MELPFEITTTDTDEHLYLKVLVYGTYGAGKTRLVSTLPQKTLLLSAEGGTFSLQDKKVHQVKINSLETLNNVYTFLKEDTSLEWVAIDSISEIAETILAREKKYSKDGRAAYGEMADKLYDIIRKYRDLPKNIYMTAKQEKVKDDMTGGMIYSPSMPGQKVGQQVGYFFDIVCPLLITKNEKGETIRYLQTERDISYEAKDRTGKLNVIEPADLSFIYNKVFTKQNKEN